MKFRSFSLILLCLINLGNSLTVLSSEQKEEASIKLTVHNVGQGNCIAAELYDSDTKERSYLLIDAGSSAYKKEMYCRDYFIKRMQEPQKEQERNEEKSKSPVRIPEKYKIPESTRKQVSPTVTQFLKGRSNISQTNKDTDLKQEMIKAIRMSLGMRDYNLLKGEPMPSISVKTFFVSHPDTDHYKWAEEIFSSKQDLISNIILGGLPENYSDGFRTWLQQLIEKKTNIYFPALLCDQPITSIEEILLKNQGGKRLYAPQMFSNPKEEWQPREHLKDFEKALPFGKYIKTYLLSVNPTHWKEEGKKKVERACLIDDDNSDSLVIKLQLGSYSAIFTGDATNMTTDRIRSNYEDSPNFLKCTVLTADHHGAKTHGSNNSDWINATSPQHVIFSCGALHGHPSLQAYERFKSSPHLTLVDKHDIWVWETEKKKKGEEQAQIKGRKAVTHQTHRSLFSTFNSGTLIVTLPLQGKVTIETQDINFETTKIEETKIYQTLNKREKKAIKKKEDETAEVSFEEQEIAKLETAFTVKKSEKPVTYLASSPYGKKARTQVMEEESLSEGEKSDKEVLSLSTISTHDKQKIHNKPTHQKKLSYDFEEETLLSQVKKQEKPIKLTHAHKRKREVAFPKLQQNLEKKESQEEKSPPKKKLKNK